MKRLLIFGAGGHGRVVADAAQRAGGWTEIAFADDRRRYAREDRELPVLGPFSELLNDTSKFDAAALGIGDNAQRLALARKLRERGVALPAIVHPAAVIAADAVLEDAVVVFARAVVQTGARVGFASIVNTAAVVEHDCVIEPGVHLSPGVCLGGEVRVAEGAWVGIGASVVHGIRIGAGCMVGAGAAVTVDVMDGLTVGGVPARPLRSES